MSVTSIPIDEAVSRLRSSITGKVLVPGDHGYDEARSGHHLQHDQRPAVIVAAADAADVAAAVSTAADADLAVVVHATGHAPYGVVDGALMIATGALNTVQIDPVARTAVVGAGAVWGDVLALAQKHGLAPLLGSNPTVGAVGYVLGGGLGWLGRKYGLGSDSVRSFELVTPDGSSRHVSATENPDAFWVLRGAGNGTVGVVTQMEIELYPVSTVYAGNLLYPIEIAHDVIARWRDWVADVSEDFTSSAVVMNFPDLDVVPDMFRGRAFAILRGCWSGDPAEGQALIDTWRTWREPALDLFGELPFSEVATISNEPAEPMLGIGVTDWFDALPDQVLDIVIDATVGSPEHPSQVALTEIRHAGGAVRRAAADAVNDLGRSGEFLLLMGGGAATPDGLPPLQDQLIQAQAAFAPYATGAAFSNFLEGREKQTRAASGLSAAHLARLRQVQQTLDPDHRFCLGLGFGEVS